MQTKRTRWDLIALGCALAAIWLNGLRTAPHTTDRNGKSVSATTSGNKKGTASDGFGGADQPPPESIENKGINAADLIKNAFVLYDALSVEDKDTLSHPKLEIDEDKAVALFKKIQPILLLLHQAADADYCDWGMGSMKFGQVMTPVTKGAQLAKLSLWAAGFEFPTDPAAALESISDRVELGRAIGGNAMVGLSVETSMERSASELIRQNAGSITPALFSQYKDLLETSVLEQDVVRAMKSEMEGFDDQLKLLAASDDDQSESTDALKSFTRDPASQAKIQQARKIELEYPKMIQASDAEFNRWADGIKQDLANNPLLEFVDVFSSIRNRLREATIERTMLGAGLGVMQNGPAQLDSYQEPGSHDSFLYRKTPDGFELQSHSQFKGKPIILRFRSGN